MNYTNGENIELERTYKKMTDNELIELLSESEDDFDNNVYELVMNEAQERGLSIDQVEEAKREKKERKTYSSFSLKNIAKSPILA